MDQAHSQGKKQRFLLGLIGAPIRHSAAPAMYESAAAALGLHCHYQLIEVAGRDEAGLRAMLENVRLFGFGGVNVTFPYKEAACPLVDELAPLAKAIGAVNTVVVSDGRLIGHNTDSTGFGRACRTFLGGAITGTVALIGIGGVGKAMAVALADQKVPELRLFDRDTDKVQAVAAALGSQTRITVCASVAEAVAGADGIVNGTPVGMLPSTDTPVPFELIEKRHWVSDAVYNPLWTPLLLAARERGARVMTGRDLAIAQAVDGFILQTGIEPDAAVMGKAFDAVMAQRAAPAA